MKQYTDAHQLWEDCNNGTLDAHPVAHVPGIWRIIDKKSFNNLTAEFDQAFTFSDETEMLYPCLCKTVEDALKNRAWYNRYILDGATHGSQINADLKREIATFFKFGGEAFGLRKFQFEKILEELDLAHGDRALVVGTNRRMVHEIESLQNQLANLKYMARVYIDFVSNHAPQDELCMCGEDAGNAEHQCHVGSHAFTPAFQYTAEGLQRQIEALFPAIRGGDQPITPDEPFTVEHTSLDTGEIKQVVIPSKAPMWECPERAKFVTGDRQHILYKKGDPGIPQEILDRNGDVALACCKICGDYEQGLLDNPVCPGVIDDKTEEPNNG